MQTLNKLIRFSYTTVTKGSGFDKKTYLLNDAGKKISFWNDIPLKEKDSAVDVYNVCIEIPKNKFAKMEVDKEQEFHPIVQDTRKNRFNKQKELRYYAQFPLFNYGFIPQTWEANINRTKEGYYGDDDPLDICDLSSNNVETGSVFEAKILGAFCLIDLGEVDWKIITINAQEAKEKNIHDLEDYCKIDEPRVEAIKKWFEYIKTYDGKDANTIFYDRKTFDSRKAIEIIQETHEEWKILRDPNQQNTEYKQKQQDYKQI